MAEFSQLEAYIRQDPERALSLNLEWQRFLTIFTKLHPEEAKILPSLSTENAFNQWVDAHPELAIDYSLFTAKQIAEAMPLIQSISPEKSSEDQSTPQKTQGTKSGSHHPHASLIDVVEIEVM